MELNGSGCCYVFDSKATTLAQQRRMLGDLSEDIETVCGDSLSELFEFYSTLDRRSVL